MNDKTIHNIIWALIPHRLRDNMDDAIEALGDLYNLPDPQPFRLNFENDTILIYAYFYRYFVCISNAVKLSWFKLAEIRFPGFLRKERELNVCCIGGGSGCDLVGLCQFLDSLDMGMGINAVILDYYDWSFETKRLIERIDVGNEFGIVDFKYVKYNFFYSPIKERVVRELEKADLVTIVKFMSAVGTAGDAFEQLKNVLYYVKRNARVFFMDNSGGPFSQMMEKAAKSVGLRLVARVVHDKFSVSKEESQLMNSSHYQTYPLKSTSVTASLWKKT